MTAPVSVQLLDPRAKLPAYGSPDAAGADLYVVADGPVTIDPGQTAKLRTGLALAIPQGYVGLVCARSGMACKRGLAPANKVGVVDADYRGEVMVFLHNHSGEGGPGGPADGRPLPRRPVCPGGRAGRHGAGKRRVWLHGHKVSRCAPAVGAVQC